MLSAPEGRCVFSHVGSHQSWVGWAVNSVGADNQSSTSNLLWFLYQPGRRRRWIKFDNYEKFILSIFGDYINLLCIAPDGGVRLAMLAYLVLSEAARPLALPACVEVSKYARKR